MSLQKKRAGWCTTLAVYTCCVYASFISHALIYTPPASLPIFNRNKRPRQALLTHPNNAQGPSQPQQDAQWSANQGRPPGQGCQQRFTQPPSGSFSAPSPGPHPVRRPYSQHRDKENAPSTSSFKGYQEQQSGPVPSREENTICTYGLPPPTAKNSYSFGYHSNTYHSKQPQATFTGSTPGISWEQQPLNAHISQQGRTVGAAAHYRDPAPPTRPAPVLLTPGPRFLTASLQGILKWNQLKTRAPLVFEVYGTLNSAIGEGPLGAREFTLLSEDGTIRCLYWEMEFPLPQLVRGKAIRVVGSWDAERGWLKCHLVRGASPQEQRSATQLRTTAETALREAVARQPES